MSLNFAPQIISPDAPFSVFVQGSGAGQILRSQVHFGCAKQMVRDRVDVDRLHPGNAGGEEIAGKKCRTEIQCLLRGRANHLDGLRLDWQGGTAASQAASPARIFARYSANLRFWAGSAMAAASRSMMASPAARVAGVA